jgi:hypothetical protein
LRLPEFGAENVPELFTSTFLGFDFEWDHQVRSVARSKHLEHAVSKRTGASVSAIATLQDHVHIGVVWMW